MIKRHENKITMLDAVHAYLSEHDNIIESNSGIAMIKEELGRKITEIRIREVLRENVNKGKTKAKHNYRNEIIRIGLSIASKLYDYGKKSGNAELLTQSDFARSDLSRIRDSELINLLHNVSENTEIYLESLSSYGITREKADEFISKMNAYRNSLENQLASKAIRISAKKSLVVLFNEADMILTSLDKMVEEFHRTDVQFYNGYKSARSIKNLGIRHRQPEELIPETGPPPPQQ